MKHLLIILFFLPLVSFSQQDTTKQITGKVYTKQGGPYSVTVIFHRNKQAISAMTTQADSLQGIFDFVERERKKLGNDVIATFHRITYHKPGSKEIELDVSAYNQKSSESIITPAKK